MTMPQERNAAGLDRRIGQLEERGVEREERETLIDAAGESEELRAILRVPHGGAYARALLRWAADGDEPARMSGTERW